MNRIEPFVKRNHCISCPELPTNNAELINLPTKLSEKRTKYINKIADLNKVDQTTNEFIIDNTDSINLPTKFIENNLNKVDQTTNQFTIDNTDSTNIPTKFMKIVIRTYQI